MERDRVLLLQKTFRTLNAYFYRHQNLNSSTSSSTTPPLAVQRVKVTFKDEPGEGSGVARSFYALTVQVKQSTYNQCDRSDESWLINIIYIDKTFVSMYVDENHNE
jgi:hypothetical protein